MSFVQLMKFDNCKENVNSPLPKIIRNPETIKPKEKEEREQAKPEEKTFILLLF